MHVRTTDELQTNEPSQFTARAASQSSRLE